MRRPLCLVCLAFAATLVSCLRLMPIQRPDFGGLDGHQLVLEGQVYQKEYKKVQESEILIIYLKSVHILEADGSPGLPGQSGQNPDGQIRNIICYLQEGTGLEPLLGSRIRLEGRVSCFSDAGNPGEFDMGQYYRIHGLDFRLDQARILAVGGREDRLQEGLYRLKTYFAQVLDGVFGQKEASIMKAMLLGEKNGLDQETKELYQESSIIHILSISGLHISIIGMGLYRILRRCGIPLKLSALLCTPVILGYAMMTGMSMSSVRAVFMFLMHLGANAVGRTYDMVTALSVAAVLLLLEQPGYVGHSGFLFSFGAVAAIGVFMPVLHEPEGGSRGKEKKKRRFRRLAESWKQSLASCVSVFLVTLPVNLAFYYQFPIYSVPLNLAVIPLMTMVMGAGLFCMLFGAALPLLALPAAYAVRFILWFYEQCCLFCERIPGGIILGGQPEAWQIMLYLTLLGILVLVRKKTASFWKGQWILAALCLLLLRGESGVQVTMLDVGQGDCIHIRSESGRHYLIDGGSTTKGSVETYQILPYLKSQGIRRLEAVFVTHSDLDHCSGILALLEEYPKDNLEIGCLVLPDIAEESKDGQYREMVSLAGEKGIPVKAMGRGQFLVDGDMRLYCIHPQRDYAAENANESSLVLYLTYGSFSGLFTGDVEGMGEREAQEYLAEHREKYGNSPLTLLKVAHHGSRNSTGEDILEELRPRLALISSGRDNRYGHPHEEVLERLAESDADIYLTPVHGAVTVETDGGKYRVRTFRE